MENQNRDELFTRKVIAGRRTYHFNVKQSNHGDIYIVIHEATPEAGVVKHHRIVVYEDHIEDFQTGLAEAAEFVLDAVAGRGELNQE
ncbi:MAG: DUF3276 family protein [Calditrichaeota bacterium]|nr:DUF3276 family protein [Calditrichota bacterium]